MNSQIEAADAECVAAGQQYVCAAGKAAGVHLKSDRMALLLQVSSADYAAEQQVKELRYFAAEMLQQQLVVSAKVERLQQQLIDRGVLAQTWGSSSGSGCGSPCCVTPVGSRSSSSSGVGSGGSRQQGSGKGCSAEQLAKRLCEVLAQQQQRT